MLCYICGLYGLRIEDQIHEKYAEKHPKLLAKGPVDYKGARMLEAAFGPFSFWSH